MTREPDEMAKDAQAPFQRANHHRAYGDPETVRRLAVLDERAAMLKDHLRRHCRHHEAHWIARQAVHLWRQRFALVAKYPRPIDALGEMYPEIIMEDARRIVRARAAWRLARINRIRARMENAILCKRNTVMRERPLQVCVEFKKHVNRRLKQ